MVCTCALSDIQRACFAKCSLRVAQTCQFSRPPTSPNRGVVGGLTCPAFEDRHDEINLPPPADACSKTVPLLSHVLPVHSCASMSAYLPACLSACLSVCLPVIHRRVRDSVASPLCWFAGQCGAKCLVSECTIVVRSICVVAACGSGFAQGLQLDPGRIGVGFL